jgi:hypothetical protein
MIATTICSQNGHHLHRSCSPITLLNSLSSMGSWKNIIYSLFYWFYLHNNMRTKGRTEVKQIIAEKESIKVTFLVFLKQNLGVLLA